MGKVTRKLGRKKYPSSRFQCEQIVTVPLHIFVLLLLCISTRNPVQLRTFYTFYSSMPVTWSSNTNCWYQSLNLGVEYYICCGPSTWILILLFFSCVSELGFEIRIGRLFKCINCGSEWWPDFREAEWVVFFFRKFGTLNEHQTGRFPDPIFCGRPAIFRWSRKFGEARGNLLPMSDSEPDITIGMAVQRGWVVPNL